MEASSSRILDNPVLFHPYHGENIELLENRRRAIRRVSFEKGIVFSERCLKEDEYFFICIENVEGGWAGHLRIGLTTVDPNTQPTGRNLDGRSWLVSVSPFIVPFPNISTSKALPTEKGSLIGVYFERKMGITRVHVVINGSDLCPDFRGIPVDEPLFAVVDVFGNTKEVRVVVPEPRTPDRLSTLCSERVHCLLREGRCSTTQLPVPLRNQMREEEHQRHYQLQESEWAMEMQEYWLRQRL